MFKFLFRCLLFFAGLALVADTGLPARAERLQVDRHSSYAKSDANAVRSSDTSYTLHLTGGRVANCSVGYAAYSRLKDGDSIEVRSTRFFKHCLRIAQGDDVIEDDGHWKWVGLIFGLLMMASAVGLIRNNNSDDEDRDGFWIRLG